LYVSQTGSITPKYCSKHFAKVTGALVGAALVGALVGAFGALITVGVLVGVLFNELVSAFAYENDMFESVQMNFKSYIVFFISIFSFPLKLNS
jgi:uncharacterized protein YqgC (DUF456 family)